MHGTATSYPRRSGHSLQRHRTDECRPYPLSIAGGDPHAHLTCLSLPRRCLARKGALSRSLSADPWQARHRRGFSAAGSAGWGRRRARDTQQGQFGGGTRRPLPWRCS